MRIKNRLTGLIAAPFTPMNKDGSVKPELIPQYADQLKNNGVKGAFICGTTGEGMFMTNEERKSVAEKWVAEQSEDFKVIVHVGTTSSKQSNELAQHAQKAGAYAVGCIGPVFLQPARVEALVGFCAEVATGSPRLPFYYYHIPSISGIELSMTAFTALAGRQIPNFAGIKFTDNNFVEMQECIHLDDGKYDILHGYDELLLTGLVLGAKGAVGSTYNFMASLYREIIHDFEEGNLEAARQKQRKSIRIINILNQYGGAIVAGKRLMKTLGIDCGHFRLPMPRFREERYEAFRNELKNEGLFEIINS